MGGKPRIECLENGDVSIRLTIPRPIALIADSVGKSLDSGIETGLKLLLVQIRSQLEVGQAGYLGPMFESALKQVRDENFGAIASGKPIDVSLLHKSMKLKSGYVGVYANGNGFRAVGPGGRYIVTSPTAEEAAWRRRSYYVDNRLPYGELEVEIDTWTARGDFRSEQTLEDKVRAIMEHAHRVGTAHLFAEDAERILGGEVPVAVPNPAPHFDPFGPRTKPDNYE